MSLNTETTATVPASKRNKRKPRKFKTKPAPAADTLADDRLDGAAAIGAFLGLDPDPEKSTRKAYHALAAGHIPHTREGDKYVGSKRRLIKHYTGE